MSEDEIEHIRKKLTQSRKKKRYSIHEMLHDEELLGLNFSGLFQLVQEKD